MKIKTDWWKAEKCKNWEEGNQKYSESEYNLLLMKMSADSAKLNPDHFISTLWNRMNLEQFESSFQTPSETSQNSMQMCFR